MKLVAQVSGRFQVRFTPKFCTIAFSSQLCGSGLALELLPAQSEVQRRANENRCSF
jgi:hypothetical protein